MYRQHYGIFLIVTLVALRVVIGMHFFREGLNKLRDPKPFSAGFFGNAQGPFAPAFHQLVWDRHGVARLDVESTHEAWDEFRARVERHYGFDDNQKKRAAALQKRYEEQLRDYLAIKEDDLREYRGNLERYQTYVQDDQRMETPSLRGQVEKIESELRSKRSGLMSGIDPLWQSLATEMNGLATEEQRERGLVKLPKPGRRTLDSESIDRFIPWFDTIIGVLLIVGLATRPAALAAAAFLFSVMLSQWPLSPAAISTWPQAIEAVALLVVAAAGAGQYAGLDALVSAICCRKQRPAPRGT